MTTEGRSPITAIVVCRNEAAHLRACLPTVRFVWICNGVCNFKGRTGTLTDRGV